MPLVQQGCLQPWRLSHLTWYITIQIHLASPPLAGLALSQKWHPKSTFLYLPFWHVQACGPCHRHRPAPLRRGGPWEFGFQDLSLPAREGAKENSVAVAISTSGSSAAGMGAGMPSSPCCHSTRKASRVMGQWLTGAGSRWPQFIPLLRSRQCRPLVDWLPLLSTLF